MFKVYKIYYPVFYLKRDGTRNSVPTVGFGLRSKCRDKTTVNFSVTDPDPAKNKRADKYIYFFKYHFRPANS